mgnify:FL=1|jgi:phage terminase small subunit
MANTDSIIDGLTQKQALFVSEYLKNGGNATQAYLKAGYKAKDEKVACTAGTRLLRNVRISRAIAERQKQRNERLQLEEDFELKQAMKILKMCSEPKQVYTPFGEKMKDVDGNYVFTFDSKGANQALTTICRLRGKFIERKQIDVNVADRSTWLNEVLKDVKDE